MASPSIQLVHALRDTAVRLRDSRQYSWGHMGSCNCGHLAQTITKLDRAEIHRRAMERAGDWGEQALEACPTSGYAMDHVFESMFEHSSKHFHVLAVKGARTPLTTSPRNVRPNKATTTAATAGDRRSGDI